MIRRPPRPTHCISSAASDVYKRQLSLSSCKERTCVQGRARHYPSVTSPRCPEAVSYTHLRAHETRRHL
eukprot:2338618-Prorocentrum_lima.AAC.1